MLKNIIFLNNEYNFKSHKDENILQYNSFKTKIFNNILLVSQSNDDNTNYNSEHAHMLLPKKPNNDIIVNFLNNNIVKNNKTDGILIDNAFFFMTYTSAGHIITHNLYDLYPQLNFFWKDINTNKQFPIIIENISLGIKHKNINFINDNMKKIIQYLRDLNIKNDIYIISNKLCNQFKSNLTSINIWQGKLFIKNLYFLIIENPYISYLGLTSRYVLNSDNLVFNETLKNFIQNNNSVNIHYAYHKKKFLILEKRLISYKNPVNKPRGFINWEWNSIVNLCDNYCSINNLKLVIWDNEKTSNSIFKQQILCNNAEIIISTGGSFNLFNVGHTCSRMLILDISPRENPRDNIFKKICLNIFADHSSNTKLYFYFNHGPTLYHKIIKKFLFYNY